MQINGQWASHDKLVVLLEALSEMTVKMFPFSVKTQKYEHTNKPSPELRLQFAGLGDKILPNRVAALWGEKKRHKHK